MESLLGVFWWILSKLNFETKLRYLWVEILFKSVAVGSMKRKQGEYNQSKFEECFFLVFVLYFMLVCITVFYKRYQNTAWNVYNDTECIINMLYSPFRPTSWANKFVFVLYLVYASVFYHLLFNSHRFIFILNIHLIFINYLLKCFQFVQIGHKTWLIT